MGQAELIELSLSQAGELVRTRQLSPVELTRACLERIERLNPSLNAWITITAESALAEARAAEETIGRGEWRGSLHGLPIGLKDLFDTGGVRTTAASAFFVDRMPDEDAEVVRRLRAAGAVILGKQNLHELAFGTTSAISHFGPVRNPWNPARIAGGSSGGSAAAVATGMGFGALGSDTGGSIRIPAAHCGVVGLKPTFGRVSKRGVIPLSESLDHVGPIARTARDAAILLQAIAGHDPADPASRDVPVDDYIAGIERPTATLRIGVPRGYFFEELDAEAARVVEAALAVVGRLTSGLRDVTLPVHPEVNATVLPVEAYAFHRERIEAHPERFSPPVLGRLMQGREVTPAEYERRHRQLEEMRAGAPAVFREVDLLVTPTVPILPIPIAGAPGDETSATRLARLVRPFNAYGWPALSLPCGFSADGLPVGLQIVGPPWGEALVLRLAHAFEGATEWHTRRAIAAPLPWGTLPG